MIPRMFTIIFTLLGLFLSLVLCCHQSLIIRSTEKYFKEVKGMKTPLELRRDLVKASQQLGAVGERCRISKPCEEFGRPGKSSEMFQSLHYSTGITFR